MNKQIGRSLQCVPCVAIQDGHFSLQSLCGWETLPFDQEKCHNLCSRSLRSAVLNQQSSVALQSFAEISFVSLTVL